MMRDLFARVRSRRDGALVPADTVAGRALVAVVAVLSFLASLAAGGAEITASATRDWRGELVSEATIQLRQVPGRDIDADLRRAADLARRDPAIRSAELVSNEETRRLLEPWLGRGLDMSELPIPRLVVLKLAPGSRLDAGALQARLRDVAPGASVDDHGAWVARLTRLGASVVALAFGVTILVLAAAAAAVAFATAGAMADNREVVDVLRLVGATDRYVAAVFQSRFWRLGLRGGLIGAATACLFITVASFIPAQGVTGETEALFGSVHMGPLGFAMIAAVPVLVALIAAFVSRRTVRRYLSVN